MSKERSAEGRRRRDNRERLAIQPKDGKRQQVASIPRHEVIDIVLDRAREMKRVRCFEIVTTPQTPRLFADPAINLHQQEAVGVKYSI